MHRLLFLFLSSSAGFNLSAVVIPEAGAGERFTPPLNTVSTAPVGGAVLHQGEVYQRAAIHLAKEIKFGKEGAYALTPGFYFRTGQSIGWESYSPADGPHAGSVKKAPGAVTLQGSFLYSNDGQTIAVITNFYQAVNAQAEGISRTTRPAWSADKVQQSLVYVGKTGNRIKLNYREIWMNIVRPSGGVAMEVDLAESKVVEIQGARIEIINATGEQIRYRVTKAFNSAAKAEK